MRPAHGRRRSRESFDFGDRGGIANGGGWKGIKNITHVGIYLTNNKFAHASTSQGVTISDLAEPYWQKRLYSLGRVPVSASAPN